jgi:hypothetical protein
VIQSLKRFIIIKILNLISILGNKGEIIVIKGLGKFFRGECCSRFIIDKLMLDHIYDCVKKTHYNTNVITPYSM